MSKADRDRPQAEGNSRHELQSDRGATHLRPENQNVQQEPDGEQRQRDPNPEAFVMGSRRACLLTIATPPAISMSNIGQKVPRTRAHNSPNRKRAPACAVVASAPAPKNPPMPVVTPNATRSIFRMAIT
jgi:hypothetical protein